MNATIKRQWVKALRSGKYEQTDGQLSDGCGFCCLGVLCDLVKDRVGGEWRTDHFEIPSKRVVAYGELPILVADFVGLDSTNPDVGEHSLAEWNDGPGGGERKTFREIADLIEQHL